MVHRSADCSEEQDFVHQNLHDSFQSSQENSKHRSSCAVLKEAAKNSRATSQTGFRRHA